MPKITWLLYAENPVAPLCRKLTPRGDEVVRAMAYAQRAHYLRAMGLRQQARSELLWAIETFDRFDSLAEGFEARLELAQMYADQGQDQLALRTLHQALRAIPELRAQTANPEYRSSVVQSVRPALSLEIDLLRKRFNALAKQGRFDAAQTVARESLAAVDGQRASGFEAWRAEYLEGHANRELSHLLAESANLYRDMAERRIELNSREDRAGTHDPRAQALREDIAQLRARLGVVTSEVARRSHHPRVDQATWQTDGGIEGALAPDQGAIEYWTGGARAYAWVVKGQTIDWIELPASVRIEQAARSLHALMRSSATSADRREACAELYRLALAPLRTALSGVQDLTVIPDGALDYVPFAALRDPNRNAQQYLVQALSVSIAPALRTLVRRVPAAVAGHATGSSQMLLVADPVYTAHDPRLVAASHHNFLATSLQDDPKGRREAGGAPDLPRLESSAREAAQIRALLGAQNVDLLEGEAATREAVLAKDLPRYRFIHIASHGLIDSEIPQLSALVLATHDRHGAVPDPYLRASDLLTRTFHAEAVVLSACDTSLGKEYASEGLVGLRYAALARGAHAVVASLWSVPDGITASLMTDMYRSLAADDGVGPGQGSRDGLRVARALTTAIRDELERARGLDPALWAPFTVYVAGD